MGEHVMMTGLEERLANDPDGNYRDELITMLDSKEAELKQRLDSGLPPDEFQKTEKMREAVIAAKGVIELAWRSFHSG